MTGTYLRLLRHLPALTAFIGVWLVLLPAALTWPQEGDERQYVWSAAYFGGKAARLDFRPEAGADAFLDPGWDPASWWDLTQPMGARLVYAVAMGSTGTAAPLAPFSFGLPPHQELVGPATQIPPQTLVVTRLAGVLCAALGSALIARRLAWRGVALLAALLVLPGNRTNLALAWAEGPLLLGFGLCVASFGSRWFGAACGLAATFKLTAVGLWPVLLLRGPSGRGRWALLVGCYAAPLVWAALTPSA